MDNFMNKLAEKISAQDIIRANSQAEAAENERIKQEAEQYKAQLQQLKQNAEEYKKYLDEYKALLEEMKENTSSYTSKLDENATRIHDVGVQTYRNVQAVVEKSQDKNREEIRELGKELGKKMDEKFETVLFAAEKGNGALLPLTIITMILVIADIVINVLRILGIF